VRRERLGLPQSSRDVFTLLAQAGWIEPSLAEDLKRMVGFRNVAARDYQNLQIPTVVAVTERHLDQFLHYTSSILRRESIPPAGHQ
ncbi:MAG: type VII toxin-antitoxin system HepT family RNase toxin, partial [Acidobacteriota bacterium]